MTTAVELEVPAERIGAARTFERTSAFEFRANGMIGDAAPLVWVTGSDRSTVDSALEDDPTLDVLARLADDGDGRWLYRLQFGTEAKLFQQIVSQCNGAILEASGRNATWSLRLLFHDRNALSEAYSLFDQYDYRVNVTRVTSVDELDTGRGSLTKTQYETLVAAYELGYFEVPREITLENLAEELGVSHQALSERLRRSHAALVKTELSEGAMVSGIEP